MLIFFITNDVVIVCNLMLDNLYQKTLIVKYQRFFLRVGDGDALSWLALAWLVLGHCLTLKQMKRYRYSIRS